MSEENNVEEGEVFEVDEDQLDWDEYLTEGLLPVSRIHISILTTRINERTNDDGEKYKAIGVQYEIDMHEEMGDKYPGENKKNKKAWVNFYYSGKTAQRFRALYKGCTGGKMTPTGRGEDGKPKVNMRAIVEDLKGRGCFTTLTWRKLDDDSFEEQLGWDFAQQLDELRVPKNPFLDKED